jgi:hypothetical protein
MGIHSVGPSGIHLARRLQAQRRALRFKSPIKCRYNLGAFYSDEEAIPAKPNGILFYPLGFFPMKTTRTPHLPTKIC